MVISEVRNAVADCNFDVLMVDLQEWYYDELDVPDAGEFDEPDADSDYDYEEYSSKRKKKRATPKAPRVCNLFILV